MPSAIRIAVRLLRASGLLVLAALASAASAGAARADAPALTIERLSNVDDSGRLSPGEVEAGLGGRLAVILKGELPAGFDPAKATLFLDGRRVAGLGDTLYLANERALVFHLTRDGGNAAAWKPLLGAPGGLSRKVAVGLSLDGAEGSAATPTIRGDGGAEPSFRLVLVPWGGLLIGGAAVLLVLALVWRFGAKSTLLKDNLLPQLPPKRQPYSLGRWQMAFWFTLIFAAYVFLYLLLGDENTLSTQSLVLMGLSGATAVFASAVDAAKETPVGAANEKLRALGLRSYGDVVQLDLEIANLQGQLKAAPATDAASILRLQTDIADRLNRQRMVRDLTRPFETEGWFHDLTTDNNGPALHRLQMLVWTLALGVLFLVDVYRNLAIPEFSTTLLALMGVTGAGYVGFKYPEQQY